MLVLARRVGEAVMIGDAITLRVLSVEGHGRRAVVRLGIEAPPGLPVARQEVYLSVQEDNRRATFLLGPAPSQDGAPPSLQSAEPPSDDKGGSRTLPPAPGAAVRHHLKRR